MLKSLVIVFITFAIAIKAQESPYPTDDYEMCRSIEDGVLFGIDSECHYYYYCVEEVAYLDDCRNLCDGCQFSTILNDCDFEENVQCVPQPSPPVTQAPQTQAPQTPPLQQVTTTATVPTTNAPPQGPTSIPDITCPPDQLVFLESENCTEYYICAYGRKLTMQCIEGLVWNNFDQRCDHPVYNPRCSGISTDGMNVLKCTNPGIYATAYPLDCEKFVFCIERIPNVNIFKKQTFSRKKLIDFFLSRFKFVRLEKHGMKIAV